jgi:hypothetical protein
MQDMFSTVTRFWTDFVSWHPPQMTFYTIIGFSVLAAWIMTRFAARPPLFVGPLSFLMLAFAGTISNFAGRSVVMMGTSDIQKALLFTVIGQSLPSILLLALFKASANTRRV